MVNSKKEAELNDTISQMARAVALAAFSMACFPAHRLLRARCDSFLKGESNKKDLSFALVTRGGLKDFDPILKKAIQEFFSKEKRGES